MKRYRKNLIVAGAAAVLLASLTTAPAGTNGVTADFFQAVDTGNTNYFLGKVGVGTNAPSTTLHVAGDLTVSGAMTVPRQGDLSMSGYTNGPSAGGISTPATTYVAAGYISGCWPCHVDTDTVSITNGDGYCYDKYFAITNPISVDVTELAAAPAWDWHYIYIDYSASTFPNVMTLYASTNEPAYAAGNCYWYNSTNLYDRLLGAVISSNDSAILLPFHQSGDMYLPLYLNNWGAWSGNVMFCGLPCWTTAQNPNGTWQAPDSADVSVRTPVSAYKVRIEHGAHCYVMSSFATKETTNSLAGTYSLGGTAFQVSGSGLSGVSAISATELLLGNSRSVYWKQEDISTDGRSQAVISGIWYGR